jgi:hypothetical protein
MPDDVRSDEQDDRDTLRAEYDFSRGVRGATAARYLQGANIVVIDPSVTDVFPDSEAVNDALHALAPLLREQAEAKGPARSLSEWPASDQP